MTPPKSPEEIKNAVSLARSLLANGETITVKEHVLSTALIDLVERREQTNKELKSPEEIAKLITNGLRNGWVDRLRADIAQAIQAERDARKEAEEYRDQLKRSGAACNKAYDEVLAELNDYKRLYQRAVALVFPGERDSPGAYRKLLRDAESERDALKSQLDGEKERNKRLWEGLKLIGTDGCVDCEAGRVSMYVIDNGRCLECANKALKRPATEQEVET